MSTANRRRSILEVFWTLRPSLTRTRWHLDAEGKVIARIRVKGVSGHEAKTIEQHRIAGSGIGLLKVYPSALGWTTGHLNRLARTICRNFLCRRIPESREETMNLRIRTMKT